MIAVETEQQRVMLESQLGEEDSVCVSIRMSSWQGSGPRSDISVESGKRLGCSRMVASEKGSISHPFQTVRAASVCPRCISCIRAALEHGSLRHHRQKGLSQSGQLRSGVQRCDNLTGTLFAGEA
jgi:hypothetical protein